MQTDQGLHYWTVCVVKMKWWPLHNVLWSAFYLLCPEWPFLSICIICIFLKVPSAHWIQCQNFTICYFPLFLRNHSRPLEGNTIPKSATQMHLAQQSLRKARQLFFQHRLFWLSYSLSLFNQIMFNNCRNWFIIDIVIKLVQDFISGNHEIYNDN